MSSILEAVKNAAKKANNGEEPKVTVSDTKSLMTTSSSGANR